VRSAQSKKITKESLISRNGWKIEKEPTMRSFTYHQPTEIHFGRGRLELVGELVARYGRRCLVVTVPISDFLLPLVERVDRSLQVAGVKVAHFDGVIPNPTTEVVSAGAKIAREFNTDVILGMGGGSSMDTAKAIAVEAVHPGTSWDYLFFRDTQPTEKTLPIVAVTTTSGTGSQVTQVAVVTNPDKRTKSAIYNAWVYPRAAIVDPELVVTLPPHVTASTGFDVFCHAFESILHGAASPYTDLMAWEAIRLVVKYLPGAIEDGTDVEARAAMAWADTLAGLCIANAGVTLPHGIGMTIGGYAPQVMHGEALAVTYPEFTRFTYLYAVKQFAAVGCIFDPSLANEPGEVGAQQACEAIDAFLKKIGMWLSLDGLKVSEADVTSIADHSQDLPDYKNNPRVATRDEIYAMLVNSYRRQLSE
jgi:alcohol dehydrogenase class IV